MDDWWWFFKEVEYLNKNRKRIVTDSVWKVFINNYWSYKTMNTGVLFHISFFEIKPKPSGSYFINMECSNTGVIIFLCVKRGQNITFLAKTLH